MLRVRLSGHIVFAEHAGGTASTINVDDPQFISGAIYGLETGSHERFPKEPIQKLISDNAAGIIPILKEVDVALDHADDLFVRLSSESEKARS